VAGGDPDVHIGIVVANEIATAAAAPAAWAIGAWVTPGPRSIGNSGAPSASSTAILVARPTAATTTNHGGRRRRSSNTIAAAMKPWLTPDSPM
jgi:hypothetical protein